METASLLMQKIAVRFAKTGPAVYHSHHDMIRFWERAVKRADLPMRLTQGFNPRPRIVFPHALGLGISSRHEEVELELHQPVDLRELIERVEAAAGDTLQILGAENLPPIKKSRQIVSSSYLVSGWAAAAAPRMAAAAAALMARDEIAVTRGAPGKTRGLDIRPYLAQLGWRDGENVLAIELRHSQAGSARPDEIVKILAAAVEADPYGLVVEKTEMRLE